MRDPLSRLQSWYLQQCNGDWEHESGIRIETIDNPGWFLRVDLEGTSSSRADFNPIQVQRTELDWVQCRVRAQRFEGFGGPSNLEELILVFLDWVEATHPLPPNVP